MKYLFIIFHQSNKIDNFLCSDDKNLMFYLLSLVVQDGTEFIMLSNIFEAALVNLYICV